MITPIIKGEHEKLSARNTSGNPPFGQSLAPLSLASMTQAKSPAPALHPRSGTMVGPLPALLPTAVLAFLRRLSFGRGVYLAFGSG